jgi:maltose/moltooligosaccharide transporter
MAMQPFKMLVGDMVNEEQKGKAYSIQSFLCNAGSLVGYIFPFLFAWIGLSNTAPEGEIPDTVKYAFYIGAAILILCVLYTSVKVKEMPPKEYAEFHGIDPQTQKSDRLIIMALISWTNMSSLILSLISYFTPSFL